MGIADFYIVIILKNEHAKIIEREYLESEKYNQIFSLKIFEIKNESDRCKIVNECAIDNFLPTCMILYDLLSSHSYIDNLEIESSYGVTTKFNFINEEEFINFIFTNNKIKIRSYFSQLGMLVVNRKKYYKQRKKYKKNYIKYDKAN